MRKYLIIISCVLCIQSFSSCSPKNEGTVEGVVVGLADTTKFTSSEKEKFSVLKKEATVVNITRKDKGTALFKAAILKEDVENFPFPVKVYYNDGILPCGCTNILIAMPM